MDQSDEILSNSKKGIEDSLKRLVKKRFADKPEVPIHIYKYVLKMVVVQCVKLVFFVSFDL